MDNSNNNDSQKLSAEKTKIKQDIIKSLLELYFLRNNGQICEFPLWSSREHHISERVSKIDDDDLRNDQKFSQLLNLNFQETTPDQATTPTTATTTTTTNTVASTTSAATPTTITTSATTNLTATTPTPTKRLLNDSISHSQEKKVREHEPETTSRSGKQDVRTAPPTPSKEDSSPRLPESSEASLTSSVETAENNSRVHNASKDHHQKQQEPSDRFETENLDTQTTPSRDEPPNKISKIAETPDTTTTVIVETNQRQQNERVQHFTPVQSRVEKPDLRAKSISPTKDESPTRISRAVETIVTPAAVLAENNQRQQYERVQHESAVQSRIAELRKLGLWTAKRLPKLQEPPRPRTHWDFLLEEARWLHNDYKQERKWKRDSARKIAYAAYRFVNNRRTQEERIQKEKLQFIRKIAASLSKEVRSFWCSIEKIVDFRQQTKLEETRKKAYGLHLNYILDQTSKFSNTIVDEPPPQVQQLAPNQNEINHLINRDGDGDTDKKEPVINNDEQNKYNQRVDDITAGAESIQPRGNTFETTTVNIKVPFLLKHSLREYQHIGLDWLVAMHRKNINGILADEMGLGKTIQTIALLAYLACEEKEWGPHLIVVPTSVMLNWEMEFKKWCPAFKILTYYGSPKERKLKRVGWSRPNSFHVCITSYRIVIQDHAAFRRKQWSYFILDEAHYIKNFKSQRWQMLLNFNSQHRLLLTGTPLQNDLMELWSLMHFLMPGLFDSLREFKDWFVNPLTSMVEEGNHDNNQELVQRLHKVLRPFLLRRLKVDVEKQLPKKREVIKYCRLSKRQRYLYEEFMSLSKTKETLASGNFLSVINVLMQLRKVCNHPNLFEPRPTISPFRTKSIVYKVPGLLTTALDYNPNSTVNLESLRLAITKLGSSLTSLAREYIQSNKIPRAKLVEEMNDDGTIDSDSATQEDVMEVDETSDAIESEKVLDAYNAFKERQSQDRQMKLQFLADVNDLRCSNLESAYFADLAELVDLNSLDKLTTTDEHNVFSSGNGRVLCTSVESMRSSPRYKLKFLSQFLDELVRSPEQIVERMSNMIDRYIFCVPGVSAPAISMHVTHQNPSKKIEEVFVQKTLYNELSPKFNFMNKIMVNMRTSFPELRLIEYDCGKLQALAELLINLKSNDHRVLIFTQMSRMLDILEQFLNYHGHTYLRLDGATRIDQRQILMERFNNDKRIFCFILSTRSGGLGVNLTGADTVIFYDSDWNPTMDAQAQDRCHRIGQTRDVCIYRLISEDTIEQNIYRKAQQKRMLGDLAIEDGNFGTSCFKKNAIQELFERNKSPIDVDNVVEVDERDEEVSKARLIKLEQALSKCEADAGEVMDVDAIKVARADNDTDLKEFDENIPLTEDGAPVEKSEKEQQIDEMVSQMKPVEQYAVKFLESLHHDNFKEELEQAEKEYIQELENKKSQWEQSRIDLLKEQAILNETKDEDSKTILTYPKGAKCEHVHYMLDGSKKVEDMPLWAPPTPPTSPPSPVEEENHYRYQPSMTPAMAARINAMGGLSSIFGFGSEFNKADTRYYIHEKDIYVDHTSDFLYDPNIMPESQLPPVNQAYTENELTSYTIGSKKIRLTGTPVVPAGYFHSPSQSSHLHNHLQNLTNVTTTPDGSTVNTAGQQVTRKPKVRRDEVICLPRSLFDRPQGNHIKARRDLKLQKLRCVTKGNDSDPFAMQKFFHTFSFNALGQSVPQETIVHHAQRQMQAYPNMSLLYYQDQLPPWTIQEEWAILMVIQHLQDLPVNLNILTPGHTPNWELVSETVSDIGLAHRSFKMCEYHFAREIQKREMTRDSSWDERAMQDSSQPPMKKSKKHKNQQQAGDGTSSHASTKASTISQIYPFKPSKTGEMLTHDKSLQLFFKERCAVIQGLRQKRPKPSRLNFSRSHERSNNAFVTLVRDDKRIVDYDHPLKPETIIMELNEERKRRAIAARQAGHHHMMSMCACCRPSSVSVISQTAAPQPTPPPVATSAPR